MAYDNNLPLGYSNEWRQGAAEEWGTYVSPTVHDPLAALNALDHALEQVDEICSAYATLAAERDRMSSGLSEMRLLMKLYRDTDAAEFIDRIERLLFCRTPITPGANDERQ